MIIVNKKPEANGKYFLISRAVMQAICRKVNAGHGTARTLLEILAGMPDGFTYYRTTNMEILGCDSEHYTRAINYLLQLGLIVIDLDNSTLTVNYKELMS